MITKWLWERQVPGTTRHHYPSFIFILFFKIFYFYSE